MKPLNCVWFDDNTKFANDLEEYSLKPVLKKYEIDFMAVKFKDKDGLVRFSQGIYIDLVLIDHNLEGELNGDEIIREIRKIEHNKNTPIIYYSANTNIIDLEELSKKYSNVISIHRTGLEDELFKFFKNY